MMFKSELVPKVWDNWVYYDKGTYHLYYLIQNTPTSGGDGFGVATSRDGVHWKDYGPAIRPSDKMVNYLGTGAVWKSTDFDKTGRYLCNYSEWRKEPGTGRPTQNIFFAWSDDLIHWTKFGDDPVFKVDERYYDKYGRWDCIYPMPREEGGYWGTWTATAKPGEPKGIIGLGWSEDGLHWQALPPPQVLPGVEESGAFWKFGKRFYAMFGQGGNMWSYSADKVTGPYVRSLKNAQLLPAQHTYFSRFFSLPDGSVLVNHQSRSMPSWYIAPFKLAVVDAEGILRLKYWPGNEAMKGKHLDATPVDFSNKLSMVTAPINLSAGLVAEGTIRLPQAQEEPTGFIFLPEGRPGFAVRVCADGHAEFGRVDSLGANWKMQLQTNRDQTFGKTAKFRLLARRGMLELYLDDSLVNCFSMVCFGSMHDVRFGILGDPKNSPISDLKLWQMSLPGIPKLNVKLSASSEHPAQKDGLENYAAANAMDGDVETRWCSARPAASAEWLQVDFMATRKINEVTVSWEKAHPSQYELQLSDDGRNWRTIYQTDKGRGGEEKLSGLNGKGRYLRVYLLKPADPTVPCYSIWQMSVK